MKKLLILQMRPEDATADSEFEAEGAENLIDAVRDADTPVAREILRRFVHTYKVPFENS